MHLLSDNEIGAVSGKYIISLRLFRILEIIYDLHFYTQETQRSWEQNYFNLFLLLQQKHSENIIDNTFHRFLFIYVRQ